MTDTLSDTIAALGDDAEIGHILNEVCALTGMGFAAVAFVSEERWIACQVEDRIGFGLDPGGELEIRKTICDDIRKGGKAIVIDDTSQDPDWWNHPVPVLYGFKSYASLPIVVGGHFFGTLCAIDPAPRASPLAGRMAEIEALAARVAALLEAKPGAAAAAGAGRDLASRSAGRPTQSPA